MSSLSRGTKIVNYDVDKLDDIAVRAVLLSTMTTNQLKIVKVLQALKHNPRATLEILSRKSGISLSTVHDCINKAKKVLDFELVWKLKKKSSDTEEQ